MASANWCRVLTAMPGLLLRKLGGGWTQQIRNADSWEGWYYGAMHVWGTGLCGHLLPAANIVKDITENSEMLLVWGGDPETTPWGFRGQLASRCQLFLVGSRHQAGLYLSRLELRSRRPCR